MGKGTKRLARHRVRRVRVRELGPRDEAPQARRRRCDMATMLRLCDERAVGVSRGPASVFAAPLPTTSGRDRTPRRRQTRASPEEAASTCAPDSSRCSRSLPSWAPPAPPKKSALHPDDHVDPRRPHRRRTPRCRMCESTDNQGRLAVGQYRRLPVRPAHLERCRRAALPVSSWIRSTSTLVAGRDDPCPVERTRRQPLAGLRQAGLTPLPAPLAEETVVGGIGLGVRS